jgi:nucleotide-binding universal stress UspA family protein
MPVTMISWSSAVLPAPALPSDLIERLLLGSGRPLLLAPPQAPRRLTGTVLAMPLATDGRPTSVQLESAAGQCQADLLVMGGGHGPTRELILGGCTQHFLARAERPVFLMH